ncbi:hypothetical protein [Mesorhizobium sangaii]|uniref:Uncharacterized protein n=1 Tax=Mesorhizobium sangaii TaxID=505389 RepID=A0A841PM87_9HYPH|nr:hypothetical protein [Mesorhizobium sangaii]MBB6411272.1 hypothetical protein [Mesorhizobium sangaii]
MVKKPRENRIPMMMSDEELKAIDDWRYKNRIATRSDAIRRLAQTSLRIDAPIETIYRRTKELHRVLLSRKDITISLVKADNVDWERIAKIDLATTGELIKHVSELNMAVHAMTSEVMKMRDAGEVPALKAEAEKIKADAAERTKMFRMMMKASEAGISLDDDEDDQP